MYKGKTLTWTNVRQLASYGDTTFAYGADGIRYRKGNTYYTLDGNRILREFNNTYGEVLYYYGVNGVIGFRYKNADYYYRKNFFGDIVAIHNAYGTEVATYTYDAWGKIVAFTDTSGLEIANRNPFRYRSYYYDTETSLYYLESRYYDPETGRFINADSLDYLGEGAELCNHNLFAYCGNNPVMCSDPTGYFGILGTLLVSTLVGFAVGGGIEIAKQAFNGGDLNFDFETWDWGEIGCKAILGAATGFAYGAGG